MKRLTFLFLVVGIVFAAGCSSDKSSTTGPKNDTPPAIPQATPLTVPANAPQQVQGMATIANGFSKAGFGYLNLARGKQAAYTNNSWKWSWSNGSLTVTITSTVLGDGTTEWQVNINGTEGGLTYNDWIAMTGQVSADGRSGNWTFYQVNSTDVAATCTWNTDANGNYTVTFQADQMKWVYTANADGSGSVLCYDNNKLVFQAEWQADRSGWWKVFDDNGNEINGGTWG